MKLVYHIALSVAVSGLVWILFRSVAATAVCFLTGVFLDIDHIVDYVVNYGWRIRIKHLFKAFEYEVFENIIIFLHSWEFVAVYLVFLWLIDWKPVALGAAIGIFAHLLLDHLFNKHSILGYFISFRLWHRFSAKHFYGAREYRKRLKRQRKNQRKKLQGLCSPEAV